MLFLLTYLNHCLIRYRSPRFQKKKSNDKASASLHKLSYDCTIIVTGRSEGLIVILKSTVGSCGVVLDYDCPTNILTCRSQRNSIVQSVIILSTSWYRRA